jgi:hypothetical protein
MGHNGSTVAFDAGDDAGFATPYAVGQNALRPFIDDVVESDFVVGLAFARRMKAIDQARQAFAAAPMPNGASTPKSREMAHRSFISEIATSLKMAERTADKLIETARVLVTQLPETLTALSEGRLNQRHAQILVDNVIGLSPEARRQLELRMLPVAEKKTPSQFERSVRRTRERLNPESMIERQVAAVEERSVTVLPGQDGMAIVQAEVPVVLAVAIKNRITQIARSLQGGTIEGGIETRTLTQLEADIFCDILLDGSLLDDQGLPRTDAGQGDSPIDRYRSIRPTIMVTIPANTLVADANAPGELEGYGPIDPQTAREIASMPKSWSRLLTDPVTGIVVRMGREKYRIPESLKLFLQARDGTCRFPGCNKNAVRCDLDHTADWHSKGGASDHDNLAHLCKGHHALKHATGWTVTHLPGAVLRWVSPAGLIWETEPDLRMVLDS